MPQPALDNLVRIGQLKAEARNELEVRRLLAMARTRLADAGVASISAEGRFTSAQQIFGPFRVGPIGASPLETNNFNPLPVF